MSEKIATREAYGKALVELGAINDKIVVLDADLAGATMTKYFKAAYPDRFFDCGIAECNMMNIGAGLSTMGLIPFCSTFAMFGAGRAYEQIRNSIAYPKFNVKICCSHAGVSVGEDGGSHQCLEDIGLMRLIPGMTVIVPADANEARKATFALAEFQGPAYMRTARLATPVFEEDYPFEIGKANVLQDGKDVAIFACGLMVAEALEAAKLLADEGVDAAVINVHTIKPIDAACVTEYAQQYGIHDGLTVDAVADGRDQITVFLPVGIPEVVQNAAIVSGFHVINSQLIHAIEGLSVLGSNLGKIQLTILQLQSLGSIVGDDLKDNGVNVGSAAKVILDRKSCLD